MKRIAIGLVTFAVVIGAGYYAGWRMGNNAGASSSTTCHINDNFANPCGSTPQCCAIDEPVVNLYPTRTETVNVKVSWAAGFSSTTPFYDPRSGWNILATPSGQLTNLANGKQYPYLIWEGNPATINYDMSRGFVVPGGQTATFLRHQLPIAGLSAAETNAFIAYWLPKMQNNKYNLIHFAGKEYTDQAKLTITPAPNSLLRVFMAFKPLQKPVSVTPQTFPAFQRNGFTVVEWGGTELQP